MHVTMYHEFISIMIPDEQHLGYPEDISKLYKSRPPTNHGLRQVQSLEAAIVVLEDQFQICEALKVETKGMGDKGSDESSDKQHLDCMFFVG